MFMVDRTIDDDQGNPVACVWEIHGSHTCPWASDDLKAAVAAGTACEGDVPLPALITSLLADTLAYESGTNLSVCRCAAGLHPVTAKAVEA